MCGSWDVLRIAVEQEMMTLKGKGGIQRLIRSYTICYLLKLIFLCLCVCVFALLRACVLVLCGCSRLQILVPSIQEAPAHSAVTTVKQFPWGHQARREAT